MGQILRISAFINQWKKDRRVRTGIYRHGHACGAAGGIERA